MTRTNAYSILCVCIRTFAIWMLASTAFELPQLFMTASRHVADDQILTLTLASSAFLVAVSGVLWIFADKLAKLALARPQQVVFESDIPASEWQSLAFSVVGLWQATTGIVYLTNRIFVIVARRFVLVSSGAHTDLSNDYVGWLVADCMRLLVGLSLLFGARGLVGLIQRYRQIGYTHADAIDPPGSNSPDATNNDPAPPASL